MGHSCKFQRVSRLGSVTARQSSSGRQPNFAELNRGRHLYSAGRPSRWALAHISSILLVFRLNISLIIGVVYGLSTQVEWKICVCATAVWMCVMNRHVFRIVQLFRSQSWSQYITPTNSGRLVLRHGTSESITSSKALHKLTTIDWLTAWLTDWLTLIESHALNGLIACDLKITTMEVFHELSFSADVSEMRNSYSRLLLSSDFQLESADASEKKHNISVIVAYR